MDANKLLLRNKPHRLTANSMSTADHVVCSSAADNSCDSHMVPAWNCSRWASPSFSGIFQACCRCRCLPCKD